MSFDGRFLHAAPPDLIEKELFDKQTQEISASGETDDSLVKMKRRRRRVTFLVNVWLNYKPVNIDKFPDSMIDKLTSINPSFPHILFPKQELSPFKKDRCFPSRQTIEVNDNDETNQTFVWPLGSFDTTDEIKVTVPINQVRQAMDYGGNIDLRWIGPGVTLIKDIDAARLQVDARENKKIRVTET